MSTPLPLPRPVPPAPTTPQRDKKRRWKAASAHAEAEARRLHADAEAGALEVAALQRRVEALETELLLLCPGAPGEAPQQQRRKQQPVSDGTAVAAGDANDGADDIVAARQQLDAALAGKALYRRTYLIFGCRGVTTGSLVPTICRPPEPQRFSSTLAETHADANAAAAELLLLDEEAEALERTKQALLVRVV